MYLHYLYMQKGGMIKCTYIKDELFFAMNKVTLCIYICLIVLIKLIPKFAEVLFTFIKDYLKEKR